MMPTSDKSGSAFGDKWAKAAVNSLNRAKFDQPIVSAGELKRDREAYHAAGYGIRSKN